MWKALQTSQFYGEFTLNMFKKFSVANSGSGPNNGVILDQWSDSAYQKGDITRSITTMDSYSTIISFADNVTNMYRR